MLMLLAKGRLFALSLGAVFGLAGHSLACAMPSSMNVATYLYADKIVIAEMTSVTKFDGPLAYFLVTAKAAEYLRGEGPEQIEFTMAANNFGLPKLPDTFGRALIGLGDPETREIEEDGGIWFGAVNTTSLWLLRDPCDSRGLMFYEDQEPVAFAAIVDILRSPDPKQGFACLPDRFQLKSLVYDGGSVVACETAK